MFTTFHNVSFIASTVTGLEVEMNILHILTTGQGYEVRFKSGEEAQQGLKELTDILNGTAKTAQEAPKASKTDELKATIASGFDRLQSVLEGAKTTATDKVQEAILAQVLGGAGKTVSDLLEHKDVLVQRATDMLSTLEKLLDKEETPEQRPMATRNKPEAATPAKGTEEAVKRATSIIDTDGIFTDNTAPSFDAQVTATVDAKKITADQFKQIFGTPAEPVIGDMSERQVREFIAEFVDGALANERVQQLFQNIKDNFGADEAEGAIDGYKNLILTICLQNTEMTLSEIISRYFS